METDGVLPCRGGCPNYHPFLVPARPDPLLHNILPGSRLSPATIRWSLFGHYILESSPETAFPTSLMMWEACGACRVTLHPPKRLLHPPGCD